MDDLIKALQILVKYGNPYNPTHCEQDLLTIVGIDTDIVSKEDKKELKKLGFFVSKYFDDAFHSYRFGSA